MKRNLLVLYLNFYCNKVFGILLFVFLFFWIGILLVNANITVPKEYYYIYESDFHQYYCEQSMFFLMILNGVIASFLVGFDFQGKYRFDLMFFPFVSRGKLWFHKWCSKGILLLAITSYEVILFYLVGEVIFRNFPFGITSVLLIFEVFLPLLGILLIGECLKMFVESFLVPILLFFFHFAMLVLSQQYPEIICSFWPCRIVFDSVLNFSFCGHVWIFLGICGMLGLANLLIYQKKDLTF